MTGPEGSPAATVAPTGLDSLVAEQRRFFRSGATLPADYRREQLKLLARAIQAREEDIFRALKDDLHKGAFETYTSEIGFVYEEIRFARKHLAKWMRPRRVSTPAVHQPAKSRMISRPRGISAIIAPWNYPFQLALAPLVAAIAAGNTAIVKPSEFAPATAALLRDLISTTFPEQYIACVTGEGEVAAALTAAPVDHIFYTGSTRVGKLVMRAASERLTPVSLELGGKSPGIVTEHAALEVAARRIVWGRYLNAGQTCVAVDYLCVHRSVHERFLTLLAGTVREFFGDDPRETDDYGRIINETHYRRLATLMDRQEECRGEKPVIGGDRDDGERYIAPTVYTDVSWDDPLMEDEIFGPLLPVLVYDDLDELIEEVAARPTPLAAYIFTESREEVSVFERRLPFGGASINDTIVHLVNLKLPFGGCGPSGHGAYHGEAGFREFSHVAGVMHRSSRFDVPLKYPPYGNALRLVRRIMRP